VVLQVLRTHRDDLGSREGVLQRAGQQALRLVGRGQEEDLAVPPADKYECLVVQQEHEEVHHGHEGSASAHGLGGLVALNEAVLQLSRAQATGDSPFFLTFAHNPRLPYFDIEKPRMFYDSSYMSDMYEISRAAHKVAKENFEEQQDRQEDYYDKKSKY
jgi:hypothetical protein